MSANVDKLKAIMREMFQLDQAELDFGIYRIMNQKRDEIEKFLDEDLLPQVEAAFSDFGSTTKETLVDELDKMKIEIERLGYVAEDNTKYLEKKTALAKAVDVTALENEVFSHLANFFRRYYQGGDFLSLRRYKAGVYAIPYEGEEVKLHWANADQYYIKSSENFRDYTFRLQSGKKVHLKLIEASTEQNNKKEQAGKERRFILTDETPLLVDNGELYIRFEYRVADENSKQAALNEAAVQTVFSSAEADWKRELSALAPTEKNPRRTILGKYLNDYTAKYTFDYFIHKDLGGFMRRELDFFIKNEVLFIDDLDADHVKSSIAKVKVVKGIGLKIIAFLEQLENFQKKLWLKKKFVVETGYCVTLDKVPKELYPAIIANSAQVEEWKRLFTIQEVEGDLHKPSYSEPLTAGFLKTNPYLVLDTAFFDHEFTDKLLSSFDNLDENIDGLLVSGENFHALNLLQGRYCKQVKCVYIDPPYNAQSSEIIYKNSYKHSSWLSLMQDRVMVSLPLLEELFVYITAIDEVENMRLSLMYNELFPGCEDSCISIVHNPTGQQGNNFSFTHEFAHFIYPQNINCIGLEDRDEPLRESEPDVRPLRNVSSGINHLRESAANCFYPILIKESKIIGFGDVCHDDFHPQSINVAREDGVIEVYPIDPQDVESKWVFARQTVESIIDELTAEYNPKKRLWDIIRKKSKFRYKSLWEDKRYSANSWGSVILNNILPNNPFTYPKSIYTVQDCIDAGLNNKKQGVILDFFAGSGTTGHAIINLNRQDKDRGSRKYILVEMGEHFNTVLKPRIQKVIYSKDWNNGKPISREGSSHLFKYIRLESYEDALNNLQLTSNDAQQSLLSQHDKLREEYMLSYMLDVESQGSASLLNVDKFKDPFNYQMKIARGNETKDTTVDLMETFNYLLGIKVLRISAPENRTAEFERDGEGRLQIKGKPRSCAAGEGWLFREVEGATLSGEKVLIIWRTLTGNAEEDNLMLESYFSKRNYSTLDFEFNRIYVNGDNNLENLKIAEEQWKVALIEEEFKRLMFDVEGV